MKAEAVHGRKVMREFENVEKWETTKNGKTRIIFKDGTWCNLARTHSAREQIEKKR